MNNNKKQKKVYLVVYAPDTEEKFKIVPIQFEHLSYRHPLIKKTGAIFADEEYAKQFYNFVVTNAKKQDEERKQIAAENVKKQLDEQSKKRILDK